MLISVKEEYGPRVTWWGWIDFQDQRGTEWTSTGLFTTRFTRRRDRQTTSNKQILKLIGSFVLNFIGPTTRHGDPVSPYLILFCVEGFSALLRQAQLTNEVVGVCFGRQRPTITHLLFTDNSVVFLEANPRNLEALRGVIMKYEESSRQKSSIYLVRGVWRKIEVRWIIL
jgi:hypothetical protein